MSWTDMCIACRNAIWDYLEYFGSGCMNRQVFVGGCKKGLEPTYNEEQETYECEEYNNEFGPED